MLTLEERERRAYIEGRVEEAQLLGELDTALDDALDVPHEDSRVEQLESDLDELRAQLRALGEEPNA